jgi:hypothetical protein
MSFAYEARIYALPMDPLIDVTYTHTRVPVNLPTLEVGHIKTTHHPREVWIYSRK